MNARILRKWSIHTKNLMSCSVCSLVVVVLLLLVTCAPSLILATMNFRSDASFATNPQHKPQNVLKEETLSLSLSSSSLSSSSSSSSLSTPTLLTSLFSILPNKNHRLAPTSEVEVAKSLDTNRELFPGYYKNYHTDDTQPLSPQQSGYISNSSGGTHSYNGPSIELMSANSKSRQKYFGNKQLLHNNNINLGYTVQLRRRPRHRTPPLHFPIVDDALFGDGITQSLTDKADAIYDEYKTQDDKHASDSKVLYVKNGNSPSQTPSNSMGGYPSTATEPNRSFLAQQRFYTSNRRVKDITHHVAQSPLSSLHIITPTKTLYQLQPTSRTALAPASALAAPTSAHLKQPELIHSNINNFRNVKSIFSRIHNKSVVPVAVPVPIAVPRGIDNSNVNKIKPSVLPLRLIIESYEVPASLPLTGELTEQQRRMLIHEQHLRQLRTLQQQAARNRRDSLRGHYKKYQNDLVTASSSSSLSSSPLYSLSATNSFRKSPSLHHLRQQQHQHPHQHQHQQRMRKHSRRYCSARDPAQLAFEAPTVFEGKIVSMTPDRRQNFSATVEVREVFKQQIGYRLQKYLRLQFAYHNNSGECDIYREELRLRGLVRGDTIEPGRLYLLFVQQIDIGNFTILGQPIRKTKRVVEAVRYAVSGSYEYTS